MKNIFDIKTYLFKLSVFLILIFFATSCEKKEGLNNLSIDDEFIVSSDISKTIAQNLLYSDTPVSDKAAKGSVLPENFQRNVHSVYSVTDANGIPAYHIINYEDSGFVIISGDRRFEPILAFSQANSFPNDEQSYPEGLTNWLESTKTQINQVRKGQNQVPQGLSKRWENLENHLYDIFNNSFLDNQGGLKRLPEPDPEEPGGPGDPNDPYDCETTITQKGPLLQTQWYQRGGFNATLDNLSCGKPPAGCVAVAMGQIMKYYQYPSSYDWANMPETTATITTALLLEDIGIAVDMDYTCTRSYANTSTKVVPAFKNYFGYSSAEFDVYNYQTVKSQISYNRPVILRGVDNSTGEGHAWVCDGYLQIFNPCSYSVLQFNMRWGQVDGSYDGWYYYNNFNPGGYSFNYNTGMVYNIKP